MKSNWMKPIGAAVLAAGMTFAFAETPAASTTPNPQHSAAQRQQWRQRRFERLSSYLNLTDSQKEQAKTVLRDAHQSAKQFAPQLKQNREALAQAIKENKPKADIQRLADTQGALLGKMIAIRTEAFAKIYQTLTPEQRAKADQLPSHMREMMGRNGHRG